MTESDRGDEGREATAGVAPAAVLMIVATLASAVTGLVREMAYARQFGTGAGFDAYVQAFKIPDLMYFMIAGGALRTGFLPVFTAYLAQEKIRQAWRTFSVLFCLLLVGGSVVVLLGMIGSPALVYLVGPKFEAPERALCGELMRIMFPAQVFFLLGGLLMGALNGLRHFLWPAMGPIVYNVAIIAATCFWAPSGGIHVVAGAVVIGAFMGSFVLQLPKLLRLGGRIEATLDLRDEGLRRVGALVLPVVFGLAISELNFVIVSAIATDLGEGAASALNYANRLIKLPERVFGAGIAIALFPALSAHFALDDKARFRQDISFGLRNALFLSIPSAVLLAVLGEPAVRLLFERGEFTAEGTVRVAQAVAWFAPSVPAIAAQYVIARAFYAMQDTRTPVVVGALAMAVCTGLAMALRIPMGINGLALATSISSVGNAVALLELLRRRAGGIEGRRLGEMLLRTAAASAILGGICYAGAVAVGGRLGTAGAAARLLAVAGPTVIGGLVYVLIYTRLGGTEAASAWELVTRRFRRRESGNGG